MLYELVTIDENTNFQKDVVEVEEVYQKLYKLYKDKDRMIVNLGNQKKDLQYLKSDDFEEDLLKLAVEFGIEEEYRDFVEVEEYLKKERNKYIEYGITEHYQFAEETTGFLSKGKVIKERAKNKDMRLVIEEETGVTIGKQIADSSRNDLRTVFYNKTAVREDLVQNLSELSPKKATLYALRLNRYKILNDEEANFRDNFFTRLEKNDKTVDIIRKKVENLKNLRGQKLLSILKVLTQDDPILEFEILPRYEEVRTTFNETYEKFKLKFPWMLKLYTDEETLRVVYIYFLVQKKDFYYSKTKKVQYKYLLKKLINNKKVTSKEREFVLQDFFSMILLYLDYDLENTMGYIMNLTHQFVLSYISIVLEGIGKWDSYEKEFGKRKIPKQIILTYNDQNEKEYKYLNLLELIITQSWLNEKFELNKCFL